MASGRQLLVFLLLFFLAVSSSGVRVSITNFPHQDVIKDNLGSDEELKMERAVEGRMNLEIADYPGTGANNNHDPKPPGRV